MPDITPAPQHNCTGATGAPGTWNNYLIVQDSFNNVTQLELWCGGTDADHPSDQGGYDAMIPAGNTTENDFKSASDCASGSSRNISGDTTTNIWRKVP